MKPTRPTKITDVVTRVTEEAHTTELYTRKNGLKHLVITIENPLTVIELMEKSVQEAEIDSKQS